MRAVLRCGDTGSARWTPCLADTPRRSAGQYGACPALDTAPGATPLPRHQEAAGRGDPTGLCTGTKVAIQRGGPPAPARGHQPRGPYLWRSSASWPGRGSAKGLVQAPALRRDDVHPLAARSSRCTPWSGLTAGGYMVGGGGHGAGVEGLHLVGAKAVRLSHSARFIMSSSLVPGWAAMKYGIRNCFAGLGAELVEQLP